jgi:hypothetical protein
LFAVCGLSELSESLSFGLVELPSPNFICVEIEERKTDRRRYAGF